MYDEGLCSGDYVFGMNVYGILGLWKKLALENTPEVADEWGARPWWNPIWIATTFVAIRAVFSTTRFASVLSVVHSVA